MSEDNFPPLKHTTKWIVISDESPDNDILKCKIGDVIETYWNPAWYFNPKCFSKNSSCEWGGQNYYMPLVEYRDKRIDEILND